MSIPRHETAAVGLWRLIWLHGKDILLSWDLWLAIILAWASTALTPAKASTVMFATTVAGVASAIIGIVLAALAIVTAFLDAKYVEALDQAGHGVATEVFSFRFPAVIAVSTLVVSAALVLAQDEKWFSSAARWLVPACVFLFLYTLFITLNLVAAIGGHMMNRASQLKTPVQDQSEYEG